MLKESLKMSSLHLQPILDFRYRQDIDIEKVPATISTCEFHTDLRNTTHTNMKVGKPQSKRVPVRLRHKIQKASANKQRKARKDAKKNPQWRSRLKKDPGIPNLFPYKDKVLAEIEESKRKKEEEKERRREIARAQREGKAVEEDEDEELKDQKIVDDGEDIEDEDMDEEEEDAAAGSSNPMAALVAAAQARAQAYTRDDLDGDEEDDDEEEEEFGGFEDQKQSQKKKKTLGKTTKAAPEAEKKKLLPKSVLEDPIKPITRLLARLDQTPDGIQQLLDYYKLPPLVTAGSDTTTRFLIDVARKRGRLGAGGVPNLNGAALAVLGDLNDGRLKITGLQQQQQTKVAVAKGSKGEVQIVAGGKMAEPFRIEGLFGDETMAANADPAEMEVEA